MAISLKTVFLLSILIINVQQLESFVYHTRNEPVSPCCQPPSFLFNLFSYSPCACPPPSTTLPPKQVKIEYPKPNYPVSTVPPKQEYHVNKCGPPQCFVDPVKQAAELEKIFKEASSRIVNYAATATGPVIYVAETINNGADLIPMLFAASGDLLGKAISGPIKFFSKLGFGFLTGAISQIISIPITFSTSVQASIINVQPYLRRIMSIGSDCCPQTTQSPFNGIQQVALKPIGILAGASHLALGTMLNIGGSTFKLIGTLTKNGGEFAEVIGYDLKNTGSLKVSNGVNSIANFLQKLGTPSSVICVADGDNLKFYQHIEEKKEEKYEKVKIEKAEKVKPIKEIVTTESYKPTTPLYVPTTSLYVPTTSLYVPTTPAYIPTTTTKYIAPTTTKYIAPTTPYAIPSTTVKYTTAYVPPKTKATTTTTTTMQSPYYPSEDSYEPGANIPQIPGTYGDVDPYGDTEIEED